LARFAARRNPDTQILGQEENQDLLLSLVTSKNSDLIQLLEKKLKIVPVFLLWSLIFAKLRLRLSIYVYIATEYLVDVLVFKN
jgi:hypothetical protein